MLDHTSQIYLRIECSESAESCAFGPEASERHFQPQWFAAYTRANHERTVAHQLEDRGVENFLPQYESARRWKDRTVRLQLPLFPGYVFVHLPARERLRVQQVPGVVHLVGSAGTPIAVPDQEVHQIREVLTRGLRAEPHPFLRVGRQVRVRSGPLAGLDGIVVRRKNRLRFVVSVEVILKSVSVEVDEADLEAL
jgi:transcription antitermination factor NusG